MDLVIPRFFVGNSEVSLQFPGRTLQKTQLIFIRGENWDINKALAFAAFGFPDRAVQETGCRTQFAKKPYLPKGYRTQYVSSNARAEVSGYWDTVLKEITLDGTALPGKSRYLEMAIEVLELGALLNRHPARLSGGETAKMVIAAHLAIQPSVLVLDRVMGQLDVRVRYRLTSYAKRVLPYGFVVVLDDALPDIPSEMWLADCGEVLIQNRSSAPDNWAGYSKLESDALQFEPVSFSVRESKGTEFIVQELGLKRENRTVLEVGHVEAKSGTFVWVLGRNGSGKTSFLEACVGWLTAEKGSVTFRVKEKSMSAGDVVAYSPQEPELDVTETTMFAEIELARTLEKRNYKWSTGNWLSQLGLTDFHLFSRIADDMALQKLASVLAALSRGRPFCFLDEPTASLPQKMRRAVVLAVADYLADGGIVLCATHDMSFYREISKERDIRLE